MDPYTHVADAIVQKLVLVLEDMALNRARKVKGLELDDAGHVRSVPGGVSALEDLVKQYQDLLGPAGVSFCRNAVHPILVAHPEIALPPSLR